MGNHVSARRGRFSYIAQENLDGTWTVTASRSRTTHGYGQETETHTYVVANRPPSPEAAWRGAFGPAGSATGSPGSTIPWRNVVLVSTGILLLAIAAGIIH